MVDPIAFGDVAFNLVELDEIDSTNSEALRRAAAGERGPLWILARRQSGGRGRLGRNWQSLDGNLMATLLLSPTCAPQFLHHLSLLTGVAVHDAMAPFLSGPARLRLKWPNDVLIGPAKLGGILVESTSLGGTVVAAIGIGINVAEAPDIAGRAVGRLVDHSSECPTPGYLLAAINAKVADWFAIWQGGAGFEAIRNAWIARAGALGEPLSVRTHAGAGNASGTFAGLDADGALLLLDRNGNVARFTSGDVSLDT